jgi:hypothetical protein
MVEKTHIVKFYDVYHIEPTIRHLTDAALKIELERLEASRPNAICSVYSDGVRISTGFEFN